MYSVHNHSFSKHFFFFKHTQCIRPVWARRRKRIKWKTHPPGSWVWQWICEEHCRSAGPGASLPSWASPKALPGGKIFQVDLRGSVRVHSVGGKRRGDNSRQKDWPALQRHLGIKSGKFKVSIRGQCWERDRKIWSGLHSSPAVSLSS